MEFAVWHEGIKEGYARWVLHVDAAKERLLLAGDDGGFYWKRLDECKFVKLASPDNPRPVVNVTPAGRKIALPGALAGVN